MGDFWAISPGLAHWARAASETVANVGGAVIGTAKGALDVAGGALEHVSVLTPRETAALKQQFAALPDSQNKQEIAAQITKDPGAANHYMARAISDHQAALDATGAVTPSFTEGAWKQSGSAAEVVDNIIGSLGLTSRMAERTWVGLSTPGQNGLNRLQTIMAVGDGRLAFNEDKGLAGTGLLAGDPTQGLNTVEQIVYNKIKGHEWTDSQAMDFLASHGSGYSHSAIANIAGEVALDPQILLTAGTLGLGRLGVATGKITSAIEGAQKAVDTITQARDAARVAGESAKMVSLGNDLQDAKNALKIAQTAAYRVGRPASKLNVLGKLGESKRVTDGLRLMAKTYEPLQQLHVDKAYKAAKLLVDPLGSMSLHNPFRSQMVDLMTETGTRAVIGGLGDVAHAQVVSKLIGATEGASAPVANMFSRNIGTYAANVIRRVIANDQRAGALAAGMGSSLVREGIDQTIDAALHNSPRDFLRLITEESNRFRQFSWNEQDLVNLSHRMEQTYGFKEAEDWLKWLKSSSLSSDELNFLHASSYGGMTERLVNGVAEATKVAKAAGDTELAKLYSRLVLMNRKTLTDVGAQGIIDQIKNATTAEDRISVIKSAQDLYPELANFTVDTSDLEGSATRFAEQLQRRIPHMHTQMLNKQLDKLPEDLKALHSDEVYTLAFSPTDDLKWGLERSNDAAGRYAPVGPVWVDHIAPGDMAVGTMQLAATNILGQTLPVVRPLAKALDYIDAGARIMLRSISGRMVAETAKARFVETASKQYGDVGITPDVAKKINQLFDKAIRDQDIVVRPTGYSTHTIWQIAKEAIPVGVSEAEFGPRDLLNLMLRAYEGDVRWVGLTQKFSSRVKRVLSLGGNSANVLAEQAYPTLKYRINAIFQAQEKLEPWILNAWRGITPAGRAGVLTEADKETAVLLDRLMQHSFIFNADHDIAEYGAEILNGKTIQQMARRAEGRLGRVSKTLGVDWEELRNVKGVKQVNLLRTYRKGIGAEVRKAWEESKPGEWDKMFAEAQRKAGTISMDADEFAVRMMAEKLISNDVRVEKIGNLFGSVDFENAIHSQIWAPQHLGGMESLDMDTAARMLGMDLGSGRVTKTYADIRSGLAAKKFTMEDLKKALRNINADPEYVARFEHALNFSWEGFWRQAGKDFNINPVRLRELQDLIGNAAEMRGMTPVDYLSQIITPSIGIGNPEAVTGHLGNIIKVLDSKGETITRRSLGGFQVAERGAGTEEEFVNQLATIFGAHIDPSAKIKLLQAFDPTLRESIRNGEIGLDMASIENLWQTNGGDGELARYVMGELNIPQQNLGDLYDAGRLRSIEDWNRFDPPQPVQLTNTRGAPTVNGVEVRRRWRSGTCPDTAAKRDDS